MDLAIEMTKLSVQPADQGTRYLGVLGLLTECSVYVPEDIREMIEEAFTDACAGDPGLRWKRILNRVEIEVDVRNG